MNLLGGLLGGGQPQQAVAQKPESTAPQAPTASPINKEHNPAAVALSAEQPKAASKLDSQITEAKANLPKALEILESVLKTLGISLKDFTQSLLQKQPELTRNIVEEALKAIVPQQAAVQAPVAQSTTQAAAPVLVA